MTETNAAPIHGLPRAFSANSFTPNFAELYAHLLAGLRRDCEARPGLRTIAAMTSERAAHSFAQLKSWDGPDATAYPMDYARTSKSFYSAVDALLAATKDDSDLGAFQREMATTMVRSIISTINDAEDAGDLTASQAEALLRDLRATIARETEAE